MKRIANNNYLLNCDRGHRKGITKRLNILGSGAFTTIYALNSSKIYGITSCGYKEYYLRNRKEFNFKVVERMTSDAGYDILHFSMKRFEDISMDDFKLIDDAVTTVSRVHQINDVISELKGLDQTKLVIDVIDELVIVKSLFSNDVTLDLHIANFMKDEVGRTYIIDPVA